MRGCQSNGTNGISFGQKSTDDDAPITERATRYNASRLSLVGTGTSRIKIRVLISTLIAPLYMFIIRHHHCVSSIMQAYLSKEKIQSGFEVL